MTFKLKLVTFEFEARDLRIEARDLRVARDPSSLKLVTLESKLATSELRP